MVLQNIESGNLGGNEIASRGNIPLVFRDWNCMILGVPRNIGNGNHREDLGAIPQNTGSPAAGNCRKN